MTMRFDPAPDLPAVAPLDVDFCDVIHWFDVGLTDVDTPHWLIHLPAPAAVAPPELAAIPRAAVRELAEAA
jgi:hypothetical protein